MTNRTFKRIAISFALAALVAIAPTWAQAGGYKHKHHGYSYGKYHGKNYGKKYGKHYGKRYRKHRKNTVIILGALGYSAFNYPTYPHRRHYYVTDAPVCRSVSKIGYWYGRKAKIGGTACPDRFGDLYVLDGSRYLIRYLY